MNRFARIASSAAVALAAVMPLAAQAQVSFNVGAVTDWRYRGLSQTQNGPAVQGGVDFAAGGFYVGLWGSTIEWIKDAGGDSRVEVDLYGGYKGSVGQDIAFDVGVLTYNFPSSDLDPKPDTQEIYGQISFGPLAAKLSYAVSNLFGVEDATDDSKGSYYIELNGNYEWEGFLLQPHLGYQEVANFDDRSYTDFSFTVSKEVAKGLLVSGSIVASDADEDDYTIDGEDTRKPTITLGLRYNF